MNLFKYHLWISKTKKNNILKHEVFLRQKAKKSYLFLIHCSWSKPFGRFQVNMIYIAASAVAIYKNFQIEYINFETNATKIANTFC
jgi:hypothetical protein